MGTKKGVIALAVLGLSMGGLGAVGGAVYQHQRDQARYRAIEARRRAHDAQIARMEDELAIAMLPWQRERARIRSSEQIFAEWERERWQREQLEAMQAQTDALRGIERELSYQQSSSPHRQ